MEKFQTIFERNIRNPLRKQELERNPHGLDYTGHRTKITPDYKKVLVKYGIQVFAENDLQIDLSPGSYNYRMLNFSLSHLVNGYRDILPNRKPRIVVIDASRNKDAKSASRTGERYIPPGFYKDRIIFLDQYHLDNPQLLVHEYAHFVADRIPKQTETILQKEYSRMLDSYFLAWTGQNTKRKALEGTRNAGLREKIFKKLGLPTAYSTLNFDEWFAEIITHWKTMPNDARTYRFKTAMKKVLLRL